jgi:hypothetical protein
MRAADLQPGSRYDHPNPETAFEVLTRDDAPDGFVTVTARFGTGLTDQLTYEADYQLPTVLVCPRHRHGGAFSVLEDFVQHLAQDLAQMEQTMTEFATNQAHLDADVAALRQAVSDAVAELKAAAANGQSLDFSKLDALVADTQAEATADAPPAPAAPADGSAPTDVPAAPADGTNPPAA